MSDAERNENCTKENQETCCESSEESKTVKAGEMSSLNESQDFRLVDSSQDESIGMLCMNLEEPKGESSTGLKENAETRSVEAKAMKEDAVSQAMNEESLEQEFVQKIQSSKDTKVEEIVNQSSTDDVKSKYNEQEEAIPCTPPEILLPLKTDADNKITSLKRRADLFNEPPKKVLKTASMEDISLPDKKVQEEDESCHSFKSDDSNQELSKSSFDANLIIAETQDYGEDEDTTSTVDKPVKNYEKNEDERHPEMDVKEYEIDKNENFNDTFKKSESLPTKKIGEETCNLQNETKFGDKKLSPIKLSEKTISDSINQDAAANVLQEIKDANDMDSEKSNDKENGIKIQADSNQNSNDKEQIASSKEIDESHSKLFSGNVCNLRRSIELIYDQTTVHESKQKPKELVEIDEEGEKIVLDSSQEDYVAKSEAKNALDSPKSDTIYKSCCDSKSSNDFNYKSLEMTKDSSAESSKSAKKLVNGSSDSKRCDTDSTASLQSDTFNDMPILDKADHNVAPSVHNGNRQAKQIPKDNDHADLLSVSDIEPDVFIVDDKSKLNSTHSSSITKTLQLEKEIGIYVRMKCLLHVDEGTKEFLSREVTSVQCEAVAAESALTRQKNNDTSASLADISGNDNKDTSPGSVNSNPQLYQLNPSRLSFASTISSLSSASSAASLTAKLAMRDTTHFSLPRLPAKHAKRNVQDIHPFNDKQALEEMYERISKEWQNTHLLTTTVLNFANAELSGTDLYNVSHDRIDDQLQKIRSSTPEVPQEFLQTQTPKSSRKTKSVKRSKSKSTKSDDQSNGPNKAFSKVLSMAENTPRKKNKLEHASSSTNTMDVSIKSGQVITDELIGKDVFAKWSDNNYYPGKVIEKVKTKYKVNFYDGKNKVLIEDFIIPIPNILKKGLSVYATTGNYDYGSCGIIIHSETVGNETCYTVESDEGEKLRVEIKDISLSADQAQVLREEINSENKSLPSTPKHLGQITLDNVIDGKRRSKRIATPILSTPRTKLLQSPTERSDAEPSVSGVSSVIKKERKIPYNSDGISSDSNVSVSDELLSIGVQPEIIGTPYEQVSKGPQNRIKSKSRSKKKAEDDETIAMFGPIPRPGSNLFKGMSFILTCAPVESIDRFQDDKDYGSDPGTEDEEEWSKKPFVRDRLSKQILTGGGKVYTDFNEIPQDEYKSTKLITNVPNTTAKTLLCLSVGIPVYNHNWIIRCCQEGKIVNPAENELPVGWSLDKNSYIDMFQRPSNKPLHQVFVIIPIVETKKQFATFWREIAENAGAVVLMADKPDSMESFVEGTVVLTNSFCPSWAVEKANELQIPLLSTTWIIQCLIEGKLCLYNGNPRYRYNYK